MGYIIFAALYLIPLLFCFYHTNKRTAHITESFLSELNHYSSLNEKIKIGQMQVDKYYKGIIPKTNFFSNGSDSFLIFFPLLNLILALGCYSLIKKTQYYQTILKRD